jgi:signal transduction histidine kinase
MPLFRMHPANLLETIFDQARIAAAVVDAEHRIAYANGPVLQIFGIPQGTLTNTWRFEDSLRKYHFFDSSGHEIPFEQLPVMRALAGEIVEPHNVKVGLPDGSFKWLHVAAHPFSVMGLSGALFVATDETHEVELQRVAANIQKNEVLSALAGELVHNFNNILEIINLTTYVCLESSDVGPDSRARLQRILDASRHATDLTRRLAQFSRTKELQPRRTSINALIREAVALVEPLASKNIKVITKLRPDLPDVEIDPVEIEQVVFNLMLNARDAMPQGGQLTVTTDQPEQSSEATIGGDNNHCVTITVSDTGTGISQADMDHIFEPFFTTKPKGTGLGLASAQGIVRQHGGDINVDSVLGKGTAFTVSLPPSHGTTYHT